MGCDMHQKVYVWSKVEKKYVDSHEVDDMDREYGFKNLFPGRWYDIFAVLAGVRGNQFEFFDRNDGVPEFASKTFKKYYKEGDFHSCVWYTPKQLNNNLEKLIAKLEKLREKYLKLKKKYPKHYYDHWNDDFVEDQEESDEMDNYYYPEDHDSLLRMLKQMKDDLSDYLEYEWQGLEKLIDINKIAIIFYFDS